MTSAIPKITLRKVAEMFNLRSEKLSEITIICGAQVGHDSNVRQEERNPFLPDKEINLSQFVASKQEHPTYQFFLKVAD